MLSKIFTTVKYTMVTVNLLFVITGIIIISVGSSVQSAYNAYHPFLTQRFFSLPAFCIATGVIIFLIAALGFYGAFMENYVVNMAFAGAMMLIFVFQLSACIAGYALKGNTIALVSQQLNDTMDLYGPPESNKNYEITKLWDLVQRNFECCGVTDKEDWPPHLGEGTYPISCCDVPPGTINHFTCGGDNGTIPYGPGCGALFGAWVRGHVGSIGLAGVFLVLMQALAVAGALWMAKTLREDTINY